MDVEKILSKFLTFKRMKDKDSSARFPRYSVANKKGNLLGVIQFFHPWREHVFYPMPDTFWSVECLNDIAKVLGMLNAKQKEKEKLKKDIG